MNILTGITGKSVTALGEQTCRFIQFGRTNIVHATILENAGEKRPLDTDNLQPESNAAKRNHLDGATLNVSSRTSQQVVGFPNVFISLTLTVTFLSVSLLGFCVN